MRNIRIVLYGVGAIGGLVAKSLLEREGVDLVGCVDIAENKIGKDLGEVIGIDRRLGIEISENIDELLPKVEADIAIHTTSSLLATTYPQIASIIKHNVKVVSTCEELSYPYYSHAEIAKELDALAKKHNSTVLGTGINPGFLMDTLVVTLTAPCIRIQKIEAARVMDAGKRRLPFQKKIGAGLTLEEFRRKAENKQISGHVGLEESIAMIAHAIAWRLDSTVIEPIEPLIAKSTFQSGELKVLVGDVAGLRQKAKGLVRNREAIVLDFQAYLGAEEEYDMITIDGVPSIRQKIQPCVHGDIGTVAMVVNAIPKIMKAPAGLLTMKDLPIPSAATGDMREYMG